MTTGLVVVFGGHIEGHIVLENVRYFTVNYDFRKIDFRYEKKPETLVKSRFFGLFFGRGRRARLSPDGSVGASASQRSPQEIHTPRRATRASGSRLCCFSEKRKDTAYAMSFWQGQKGSILALRCSVIRGSRCPQDIDSLPLLLRAHLASAFFEKNKRHYKSTVIFGRGRRARFSHCGARSFAALDVHRTSIHYRSYFEPI